jgi:hypothetical protein
MSTTIGACSRCHFRLGAFRRQQRAAVMAGRSSMFAASFFFARPRLDCRECCGTLRSYGFWLCPRRSSRRAGLPCQPHIRPGLYPDHCPAFGTGEPQGGRHHSVKTGRLGPTPDNGDAPLDQCGWATVWAPRARSIEPIMRPASLLCPLVQRLA